MPFDWKEYLALANHVVTNTSPAYSQEAGERCAVSRAYYAAFCHARNYARLNLKFTPARSGADHQLVRQHYKNRHMPVIASSLATLHQWRKKCDYDDTVSGTTLLAHSASLAPNE